MFGKIHYDVRVEPRNIQEEEQLLAKQMFEAENSKSKLRIISRNSASAITNPGAAGSVSWGGNFIVSLDYYFPTLAPIPSPFLFLAVHNRDPAVC